MLRVLVVLAIVAGCRSPEPGHKIPARARAALEQGSGFELLSLDPAEVMLDDERVWLGPTFRGFRLLGRAPITDPAARDRLTRTLERAADRAGDNIDLCFDPRHAIRVSVDAKPVDFVICFECGAVETFFGDDDRPDDDQSFRILGDPDVFNAAAAVAGLPLSPD